MAALVVAATVMTGAVASCSGSGSDDGAPSDPTGSVPPTSAATTTTLDPLDGPVVDACGNDVGTLASTVWGVDPATGAVRWSTEVPLASAYLLRDESGDPRVSLVLRDVEAVLDTDTGAVVATPTAGAHEVLVDTTDATGSGVGGLVVDGERQPAVIEVAGLRITTAAGETGQTTLHLTATDATTAAPAWRVELGPADQVAAISPPVAFGSTVVLVTSPPQPACP